MAADWKIVTTQPYSYQDATKRLIEGFKVGFRIASVDEVHTVNVPSLDPTIVGKAITDLVTQRLALSKL